jgi:hypothetical protein
VPAVPAHILAQLEALSEQLRSAQQALQVEQERSRSLTEAAAAAAFKYDLLVDMVRRALELHAMI